MRKTVSYINHDISAIRSRGQLKEIWIQAWNLLWL